MATGTATTSAATAAATAATDDALAAAAAAGRDRPGTPDHDAARRALAELHRRHAAGLLAFLRSRAGRVRGDDLHQEVWLRVWEKAHLYRPGPTSHFRGWLFQVARNRLVESVRRERLRRAEALPDGGDPRDDGERPGDRLEDEERTLRLGRCLDGLEPDFGLVARARMAGEDYKALSSRTGVPAATLMTRFDRAKRKLKDCLEASGG